MITPTQQTALILVRKEAFYQWLTEANRKAIVHDDNFFEGDYGTYLVENISTQDDIYSFLQTHYKTLFENELREWHEPEFWPEELTRELFLAFFDVQVHRQVYLAQ